MEDCEAGVGVAMSSWHEVTRSQSLQLWKTTALTKDVRQAPAMEDCEAGALVKMMLGEEITPRPVPPTVAPVSQHTTSVGKERDRGGRRLAVKDA